MWRGELINKNKSSKSFLPNKDNEGYSVKLKMKYYVDYMSNTDDDSPLYIFDSSYGDHPRRYTIHCHVES